MTRRHHRRLLGVAGLMIAGAMLLGACNAGSTTSDSSSSSQGATASDATLRVGLAATPASLDFTQTSGAAIFQALVGNVYEGLVAVDSEGELQPLLAKSWTVSDDGLTYDFVLQEGVTFHNGDPFTAENVKFSLERLGEWTANTPGNLSAIDHVEVVSDTEAKVVLNTADYNALFWLAGPLGAMFDPNTVDSLATEANGTGPFTFESYETGVKMVLQRNDDYWGDSALVKTVELDYFADANAAANALRSGGVDALYQAEAYDQIASFESSSEFTVTTGTTQGVVVMTMNSTEAPFDNADVRHAVMYAIDREAILAAATGGYGTVLGGPAVPTDLYYEDLADTYPYDVDKAKELIASSGVTDLNVTFTVPSRPYAQAIAQVVQQELAEIGITVTLEQQEFPAVWLEKTLNQHEFDLTVTNHIEPRNVTNYANPNYYWSYDNTDVQGLFADAKKATDDAAYNEATSSAIDQIVEDAPGDWLYNPPNIIITTTGVSGFAPNYMGVGINLAGVSVSE
ncbi:ABC transporter substrate-binding protein [Brooklawnia cerclae]|uniref:Peptide/nickel transport system substrate-binding protein n=1 Tax=Brooklawnia cerclae TaxID=349934 RepID=A0ABX0SJ71_9ACTN|nr:ABC transporter substrate-binding protein [Brooklawnia cerclae]NIH57105.1 peptide/nickel transport system substrate-binding protein [Brooklawnia cerclae]